MDEGKTTLREWWTSIPDTPVADFFGSIFAGFMLVALAAFLTCVIMFALQYCLHCWRTDK